MSVPDVNSPYALFHDFDAPTADDAPAVTALASAIGPAIQILDLGCGSGRLTRGALAAGHAVLGVDLSGEMLALARSAAGTAHRARWIADDMRTFAAPEPAWRFDLAVCSHNTLYLLTAPGDTEALLGRLRALASGPRARLWVDLFNPEPFLKQLPPARAVVHVYTRQHPGLRLPVAKWMSFFPDPARRLLVGYSTYEAFEANGRSMRWQIREDLRWMTPADLDAMAARAGWRLERRSGGYDGRPFDAASERQLVTFAPT